jgi:hypothetical protein
VVNCVPHYAALKVVDTYLGALYAGDDVALGEIFHPRAILAGHVKGQPYYKSIEEYLEVVRNRTSPKALGEQFAMKVMSLEVHGAIASVKVRCPMLGFDYIDLLSLVHLDDRWMIVSKVFTHLG